MLKRPHYIAVGMVVLLALLVLNLPGRATARLKLAIGSLFLPLFGLASGAQQLTGKADDVLWSRSELARQNESLRRENEQLRLQAMLAEEMTRENDRLRKHFQWHQQSAWKPRLKLTHVVTRDPANWWRTVQIDLGSRDGVCINSPVLTPDGLVGRVQSASLTRSQVVLVGDPNCKVAAVVQNGSHDTGIIGTAGPLDTSLVELGYLSRNATLKPGQNVLTSGLGEIFPAGILIGRVADTRFVASGLETEARVKLAVNLGALREVWVLLP